MDRIKNTPLGAWLATAAPDVLRSVGGLIAEKAVAVIEGDNSGADVSAYLAGSSPQKGGGFAPSAKKQRSKSKLGTSPSRNQVAKYPDNQAPTSKF